MGKREFQRLEIGDRVGLRRPHPWAPAAGVIIAFERLRHLPDAGPCPRLRLDGGQECYVVSPGHAMLISSRGEPG